MRSIDASREGAALPSPLSLHGLKARGDSTPARRCTRARRALAAVALALGAMFAPGQPDAMAAGPPFAPPETVTLTVSDPSGAPGDTVTISVALTLVIGVDSLAVVKLCLAMDPTVLTPVSAARAAQLAGVPDDGFNPTFAEGSVCLSAASPLPLPIGAGALFTVEAVVGPLVRAGDTTPIEIVDEPGNLVLLLRTPDEPGEGVKHLNEAGLFTASDGVTCTPGDVNGDGQVNSGDAVLALRIAVQLLGNPSIDMLCGADANRDRQVNSGDAVWILRRTVGLPKASGDVSQPPAVTLRAQLSTAPGGAMLVLSGAASVHGLDLDVGYDPRQLELGLLTGTGRGVSSGLHAEHEAAPGQRHLRWADARSLTGANAGVLRLPLPVSARPGAGARLAVDRLQAFDADGRPVSIEWVGEAALSIVADVAPPVHAPAGSRARLLAGAPNPFNPSTTVRFTVPHAGHVLLEIHDASGARVATLVDEARPAGEGRVLWSGTSSAGRPVASGVYFARLQTVGASDVLRLVLVK